MAEPLRMKQPTIIILKVAIRNGFYNKKRERRFMIFQSIYNVMNVFTNGSMSKHHDGLLPVILNQPIAQAVALIVLGL